VPRWPGPRLLFASDDFFLNEVVASMASSGVVTSLAAAGASVDVQPEPPEPPEPPELPEPPRRPRRRRTATPELPSGVNARHAPLASAHARSAAELRPGGRRCGAAAKARMVVVGRGPTA